MKRKLKKILLMSPPRILFKEKERKRIGYPLGLGYISAMLKLEGFDVYGLDVLVEAFNLEQDVGNGRFRFGLTDSQIKERIAHVAPDVVGVSNIFSDGSILAMHVLTLAKQVDPDIVTIIGGNHPTSIPEHCLSVPCIDFVVLGEGEFTTGALLRALMRGDDLRRIPGIAFRDKDGTLRINPVIEPIAALDILPLPDRELFPIYRYAELSCPHGDELRRFPYTAILTSRGCTARCIFCAGYKVHGRKFRPRSAEKVLDELDVLVNKMGFKEIHFEDDNLGHDKKRAMQIFKGIIERKLDIAWTTPNGIAFYNMDREMLTAMRESGCYAVWIALESGDPDILKMIRKPMPIKRIGNAINIAKDLGIQTKGFFMYGFPGETMEQMERTFQFAKNLKLDYATFLMATPLPGTEMWNMAAKMNPSFNSANIDWENLKYARSNLAVGGLNLEEMEKLRRKVWLEVNYNMKEEDTSYVNAQKIASQRQPGEN